MIKRLEKLMDTYRDLPDNIGVTDEIREDFLSYYLLLHCDSYLPDMFKVTRKFPQTYKTTMDSMKKELFSKYNLDQKTFEELYLEVATVDLYSIEK